MRGARLGREIRQTRRNSPPVAAEISACQSQSRQNRKYFVATEYPVLACVPLHSDLVSQGFLDFVAASTDGPLFYDLAKRRKAVALNSQARKQGTKLAEWVRSLGVTMLQPIRGTRYHVHDPARGALVITREEISRHFTGVALDLLKSESFKPKIDRRDLRIGQLWSSMSGFWQTIRQVILLSLVMQLVVLASPFFLQISIDSVFPSFDYDLLLILALGFGGLTIINFMANWLRSLILVTLSNSLSYQVVVNLFRHLVRLPLDWFEKRHVGDMFCPAFDGASFMQEWQDALWDRFCMGAPARQRRSVERYNIVKRG
jgi:hypothetical protein